MNHPKVSVIVPVYNAAATIAPCVQSLLQLDYPADQFELILVDNGSKDGSLEILRSFGDRIRVLREEKRGASAARNHGIRAARFPLVAFTDADCIVDSQWLKHLVVPLSDPEVGVSGGAVLARRPCNRIEAYGETVHDNFRAITCYRPAYCDTASWASRAEVLQRLNYFDETFLRAQDCELSCRVQQAGLRLVFVREAIVYHRNESTWRGLFLEGMTHGRNSIQLLERHREFYAGFGYRPRNPAPYRQLWGHIKDFARGEKPETAACNVVFQAGKRLGRLAGSLQAGVLHL